jgi:hypothetical protein
VPGRTDIWKKFEAARPNLPLAEGNRGIGTPDDLRKHLRGFAEAGVDQVIFLQQAGRNQHEHICESLELFAAEVMPEFKAEVAEREAKKAAELAPWIEAAMARKTWMTPLADDEIPVVKASVQRAQINTSSSSAG